MLLVVVRAADELSIPRKHMKAPGYSGGREVKVKRPSRIMLWSRRRSNVDVV